MSVPENVRVLVVDGHPIMRAGLRAWLNTLPGIQVVAEAGRGDEALRLSRQLAPHLVLLDSEIEGLDALETTRQMAAQRPAPRVLVLALQDDQQGMRRAIRAGASGYMIKRAAQEELLYAIQVLLSGNLYVHPRLARALFLEDPIAAPANGGAGMAGDGQALAAEPLTARQARVLHLIAQGYTNAQIAQTLEISLRTVEFHRSNLMAKLNAQTRADLVRFATQTRPTEQKA